MKKLIPIIFMVFSLPAFGVPQRSAKPINLRFLPSGSTAITYEQGDSTSGIQILNLLDNNGNSVFSVTREGNTKASGTITGALQYSADVVADNTLTSSGALTLTTGDRYFPVIGSGGAVTGITIPAGSATGEVILVEGTSNTDTVSFPVNGSTNVISETGVTTRVLGAGDVWKLIWDANITSGAGTGGWQEISIGRASGNNLLRVASGGTGASTFTAHGVLVGEGTSAATATAVGATGTVLVGNTGADPTYSATPTLTSLTAAPILAADVVADNTVATSGAITLTAGKAFFPVVGSGGAVTGVTIPNGTVSGQLIVLEGTNNTNTVTFTVNGATNIIAANGTTTRALAAEDIWTLVWDNINSKWCEVNFRH